MTGLLWSSVMNGHVELPDDLHKELAILDLNTEARNRFLLGALDRLTARLDDAGIMLGTFKGVTAEARWYDRTGERPCLDIDLFLNPKDRNRIPTIVEALLPGHGSRLDGQPSQQTIDLEVEPHTWVDLHLDIMKWEIPVRQGQLIWDRTRPFILPSGRTVQVPDPTLSLFVALINVNRDRFRTLLGLADVARILAKEEIDWDFFDRFARTEGFEVHVYKTLNTTIATLGLADTFPIPSTGGWRSRAWDVIWRESARLPGSTMGVLASRRKYFWGPLLATGRFREAIRWWFGRLVPSREMIDHWYPDLTGPYWWRLVRGRVRNRLRVLRKRRAAPGD